MPVAEYRRRYKDTFTSTRALHEYEEDFGIHCDTCKKVFTTDKALSKHRIKAHHHCVHCDQSFSSAETLSSHDAKEHYCSVCDAMVISKWEHSKERHQTFCIKCQRHFQNVDGFATHMKSSAHQERTLVCPSRNCAKRFISAAGLVAHLESGSCPSHMTRKQITQLAIDIDTTNIVTDPSHLLHDSGAPPEAFAICATELSFNGRKYECFLCHHEYKTLSALNQHLASPVHDADIYWCPKDWQGCGTKFRVLSALCQHVESERCGIRRFKDPMQEVIGSVADRMKGLVL